MMSSTGSALSSEAILAEANRLLEQGGYKIVRNAEGIIGVPSERAFVAEDKYGVVALVVYDTWTDLIAGWSQVQAAVIEAISSKFTRAEAKAWDGYLVLLTPTPLAPGAQQDADRIRYDTSRLRKLVASGEELATLGDVQRVLLPLMPLERAEVGLTDDSLLDSLPELLAQQGINRDMVGTIVQAFRQREPLLERLHNGLEEQR